MEEARRKRIEKTEAAADGVERTGDGKESHFAEFTVMLATGRALFQAIIRGIFIAGLSY